jgi:hypothetical protein
MEVAGLVISFETFGHAGDFILPGKGCKRLKTVKGLKTKTVKGDKYVYPTLTAQYAVKMGHPVLRRHRREATSKAIRGKSCKRL